MDYRYPQDFARQMHSAEWRVHQLCRSSPAPLWQGVARGFDALRRGLRSWCVARRERRADEQLWQAAQSDPRVMADLRHLMSREPDRDAGLARGHRDATQVARE